ncbi:acyl-CoA N-acyltransferase [Mycena galopus ATCC 62051]|nr:acyl-CoA N-acyltransferase [Mycena galopus ATCC 62051]
MHSTHWQIESVTLADAPALARNNMSAFWEDPNWVIMWKTVTLPYLISQVTLRMPRNLLKDRTILRHQKAVDPATGALLGYARWKLPKSHTTTPGSDAPEWAASQIAEVKDAGELAKIEATAESAWWKPGQAAPDTEAGAKRDVIVCKKPYLVLDYLAVHPENKGKGVATALVESGLREADRMGVPVFILAFKAGRGIYERLGFKEVDRVVQDDSQWGGPGEYAVYLMVRDQDRNE